MFAQFTDGSNWWLVFGSFWTGIKLIPLSSSTGKPSGTSIYSLATRSNGVEAAGIFKYGSYYYLFTSWDKCCNGLSSTYNIRVGRATSVTGPYVDASGVALTAGGGTLVLTTHGSVRQISHHISSLALSLKPLLRLSDQVVNPSTKILMLSSLSTTGTRRLRVTWGSTCSTLALDGLLRISWLLYLHDYVVQSEYIRTHVLVLRRMILNRVLCKRP